MCLVGNSVIAIEKYGVDKICLMAGGVASNSAPPRGYAEGMSGARSRVLQAVSYTLHGWCRNDRILRRTLTLRRGLRAGLDLNAVANLKAWRETLLIMFWRNIYED